MDETYFTFHGLQVRVPPWPSSPSINLDRAMLPHKQLPSQANILPFQTALLGKPTQRSTQLQILYFKTFLMKGHSFPADQVNPSTPNNINRSALMVYISDSADPEVNQSRGLYNLRLRPLIFIGVVESSRLFEYLHGFTRLKAFADPAELLRL